MTVQNDTTYRQMETVEKEEGVLAARQEVEKIRKEANEQTIRLRKILNGCR